MSKLGLLCIGESPRQDILTVMHREMPGTELVEHGILDGLSPSDRVRLAPAPGEFPLVSRLKDGTQCSLGKKHVISLINDGLSLFHRQGIRIAVLLCTSRFPLEIPPGMLVVEAGRVIDSAIAALAGPQKTFGIMAPLAEQAQYMKQHYQELGSNILTASASPFGSMHQVEEAAASLAGAGFIVLHCMGYLEEHRQVVRRACSCPVIRSSSLVARFAAELIREDEHAVARD